MEHERERAAEYGYDDPICDSIEQTERNYKHVRKIYYAVITMKIMY